ncbi:MAG TPA: hypothetical protein VGW10_08475 [Solirubrobacteraceae bacterium]|nr:hypothetical protein [Solirubrobacteraceae bacterium]
MAWFLRRVPLWLAIAAATYAALEWEIRTGADVPLLDTWLDSRDLRVAATLLLVMGVFGLALLVATAVWGYLLQAMPSRIQLPLGLELDWTPEDAKALREIDEKQQQDIDQTIKLVRDLAADVKRLQRGARR